MDDDLLAYLAEDVGLRPGEVAAPEDILARDITSRALVGAADVAADIVARHPCVVSGLAEAATIFQWFGVRPSVTGRDGDQVGGDTIILQVEGRADAVLAAERLALNLLMRMSGIATLTSDLQRKVAAVNPQCRIAATRKTTPGFRRFEKRAVVAGGGDPHRAGLHDAFLVKDNHLLVLDDITEVVRKCRALDADKFVQIEADELEQAIAAARAGADGVLLDNFTPEAARSAYKKLKKLRPEILVEVSGGITPENVAAYAEGADRISMGFLTHSPRSIDFGLDVRKLGRTP